MSGSDSTTPSRRQLLAGMAAALVAAPVAAAAAPAEVSPLLDLMARLRAKWLEYGEVANLESEVSLEAAKQHPAPPPALMTKVHGERTPYTRSLLTALRPSQEVIQGATRTAEWQLDMLALLEAHEAECRAVDARFGLPELEAEGARISDELDALQAAIMDAPARSVADWTVKVWLVVDSLGLFETPTEDLCGGEAQALRIVAEMAKAAGVELPGVPA